MTITHEEAIKALGFSEKEARVYLALLEVGIGTVVSVANKAEIKRPTAYIILDELIRKGAAIIVPQSKKLYRAIPPQNIFEIYEEKFEKAKRVLPEIQAISKQESYKPQVLLYEGVEGVKEVLRYGIKRLTGKELKGFYAKTTPDTLKKFDNYKDYNDFLKENKIKVRGVAPKDSSLISFREQDKSYGREFREIPKEKYSADVAIDVGDTFVRFFDPVNLQGLIIENPAIAKTMGEIFEIVWEKSSDK
jgi:HTH-type transcriptional regulator, sugar sensing transcriptional regulator